MTGKAHALPQLAADVFLTDGGMETTLIFHDGFELPHFASFVLLDDERGTAAMRAYYRTYLDIARRAGLGFIIESPTWRANPDWGARLGFDRDGLIDINRRAMDFVHELRAEYAGDGMPVVASGNVGPRGDGYVAGAMMTIAEAADYHRLQADTFAACGADMMSAFTLTYPAEAAGVVLAANAAGLPTAISFTTETDGRLPNGQSLEAAIEEVDAATDGGPAYYMVNCAHVDHFGAALAEGAAWTRRVRGVRANASRLSHAELDACEELDDGDPREFGALCRRLKMRLPDLSVFGGCCGTDDRHIRETVACIA